MASTQGNSIHSELIDDQVTGWVVPKGNPEALANAVCQLLAESAATD